VSKILKKKTIADKITWYELEAPRIARKRKPGQFVIVRPCEGGERIPLTIADADPDKGSIILVVQEVGKTTAYMGRELQEGGDMLYVVGPLGNPTHIPDEPGKILAIAGGLGIAPLYPILKGFKEKGHEITVILGARSRDLFIMREMTEELVDKVLICTDDGSEGFHGLVTDVEKQLLESDEKFDEIIAIGPAIMMKFCVETARPFGVPITVSLNTIMIDGTGMCGGCRVQYGGKDKFVCVDGPEFDGYQVNFDRMMQRQAVYVDQEKKAYKDYLCRLEAKAQQIEATEKEEALS
jgi:ferredoxin--NADP+ reductase